MPHSAYQAVECAGFRRLEATTHDRRDDDPKGGNCVARWDGVGTLESVGLVGDASAVVSGMVTLTAAVTSQWLAMAVGVSRSFIQVSEDARRSVVSEMNIPRCWVLKPDSAR